MSRSRAFRRLIGWLRSSAIIRSQLPSRRTFVKKRIAIVPPDFGWGLRLQKCDQVPQVLGCPALLQSLRHEGKSLDSTRDTWVRGMTIRPRPPAGGSGIRGSRT